MADPAQCRECGHVCTTEELSTSGPLKEVDEDGQLIRRWIYICPRCFSPKLNIGAVRIEARCQHHAGGVQCCRTQGHSMEGMEGGHRYKCAGDFCPGLGWPASNTPHPTSCVLEHLNRRTGS